MQGGFAKLLLLLISICCQVDTKSKQTKYFVAPKPSRKVANSSQEDLANAQKKIKSIRKVTLPSRKVIHSSPEDSANAQKQRRPGRNVTIPLPEDLGEDAAYSTSRSTSAPASFRGIEERLASLYDEVHQVRDTQIYHGQKLDTLLVDMYQLNKRWS